jgi:hypothetical protein
MAVWARASSLGVKSVLQNHDHCHNSNDLACDFGRCLQIDEAVTVSNVIFYN